METMQNNVLELSFHTSDSDFNPTSELEISAVITDPGGEVKDVPGFWAGGGLWKIRYSSSIIGSHQYRTICSNPTNAGLHGQVGVIQVTAYEGENPLYKHGALKQGHSQTYLQHEDGKPFFWLADTWWMSLTKRLEWPEDFHKLTQDRVDKGFSVVQVVAGLYPDMNPFDERGANEAGFPWDPAFQQINPEYFDYADRKIVYMVESGLVPCIVACWGFFMDVAGEEVIRKHWDYLLARYGAYPVVWCTAGEALLPFSTNPILGHAEKTREYSLKMKKQWTGITRYLRKRDPFHRVITIHPIDYSRDTVEDASLIDLEMLQTGHGNYQSLEPTVRMVIKSVQREPNLPVINSEVCYEGICGSNYQDIQRFVFWSCVLSGACGHTYGANGIWQMNSVKQAYGPSPHGASWGSTPWEEAYQLPGSAQVGYGKKLLERYPWWAFRTHPEWLEQHADEKNYLASYAAGIPGEVRIIFFPHFAGLGWVEMMIKQLEANVTYRAYYYDPTNGEELDYGIVKPDEEGNWKSGRVTKFQDWVLVLEKAIVD